MTCILPKKIIQKRKYKLIYPWLKAESVRSSIMLIPTRMFFCREAKKKPNSRQNTALPLYNHLRLADWSVKWSSVDRKMSVIEA